MFQPQDEVADFAELGLSLLLGERVVELRVGNPQRGGAQAQGGIVDDWGGVVAVHVVGVANLSKQRGSFPFEFGELFLFAGRILPRLVARGSGVGKVLVVDG